MEEKKKHENSSYESNQALTEGGAELHTAISWTMTMEEEGDNVLGFSTTPPPLHPAGTHFFNRLIPFCWLTRITGRAGGACSVQRRGWGVGGVVS